MTRIIKWLPLVILSGALFTAGAQAQTTIPAKTCNENDVASAISQATTDGDIVSIPPGNCTWTTSLQVTLSDSIIIEGAGAETPAGGSDNTIIQDDVSHSPTDNPVLGITTAAGKSFRLTGIAFYGDTANATVTYNGVLRIGGYSQAVRIDDCHFYELNLVDADVDGWIYGVADHNVFDESIDDTNGIRVGDGSWSNNTLGDGSWADGPHFGSDQFFFMEDNTFNWLGATSNPAVDFGAANDCNNGGRMVFRHNTINGLIFFQTHEMENDYRGCRAIEVYDNTAVASTNPSATTYNFFIQTRMGTGLVWGNTLTSYLQVVNAANDRTNTGHSFGTTPNGWGYCGTTYGPSLWDGNTNSSGYPCIDQVGRGQGDLLTGEFPNKIDSVTGAIAWPNNAIEPYYVWDNSYNAPPDESNDAYFASQDTNTIAENRDYYLQLPNYSEPSATFNGTAGIGQGPLSARPTTCTPLVGYWATDTNTLYQCATTNTWTAYYTPYTYPHPLTQAAAPPAPPTNLTATAQ